MKITEVFIDMKRSNGDFGSNAIHFSAELRDGEDPLAVAEALSVLADFHLNGDRRAMMADTQHTVLADPNSTEQQKAWATTFLDQYDTWIYKVENAKSRAEFGAK